MSSSVFFKFKSQKEPSRVTFDGTGISVFELKRAIIEINKLGDGTDFDLAIYNEEDGEEYGDDTTIIPRSTSVIARRLPPAKAGRGGAARYVSGKMPVHALNSSRVEKTVSKPATQGKSTESPSQLANLSGAQTEEERIAAMFKAGAEQWDKQQEEMANATPVFRSGGSKGKPTNVAVPSHPPPTGYICYRCGEKGHWIQECPTNTDPTFDGRPRVKRTTGIPRSFLKTIEKPAALSNDGLTDSSLQPSGVMVNAEGEFVVAEPDKASWEQYQAKTKQSAAAQEAAKSGSKELQERGLECPIDKKLFVEPMKTPCCSRTYCNDCVTNALIESDFTCPGCQRDGVLIDDLVADTESAAKIEEYLKEKEGVKKEKDKSNSPDVSPAKASAAANTVEIKVDSPDAAPKRESSQTPNLPLATDGESKKRKSDEELTGQRIPTGPAAMRKSPSNPGQQQNATPFPRQSVGQTNGLPPNMPFEQQQQFGNNIFNQVTNPMGFPNPNAFMGMPPNMGSMMGMDPNMASQMMMNPFGMNGGNFNAMNGMNFPQQPNGMYGGNFQGGMMPNGGYGGFVPNPQMPTPNGNMNMNMHNPMSSMHQNMGSNGVFPNQQRTTFSEPPSNEEDNAYFRKPVNPHRHQARQRRVRPSDYREL
ncbi:MAG: hypothetical protein M1833_005749 [Piccolia ochrophora]|nr:MAG: hypothetical protein M1833_005749 [Piccolia ochrophora]